MKRSILSAVLASLLVLVACGNNEDTQAKNAISNYLMKQQASNQMISLKRSQADCISGGMVDGIGVDKLKKYHFLNEDGTVNEKAQTPVMSTSDSRTMVDSMFRCTDVMKTMQNQLTASMGNQPAPVKQCFEKALTRNAVHDMLVASLSGNRDAASRQLLTPLMQCASLAKKAAPSGASSGATSSGAPPAPSSGAPSQ